VRAAGLDVQIEVVNRGDRLQTFHHVLYFYETLYSTSDLLLFLDGHNDTTSTKRIRLAYSYRRPPWCRR
jgi:hypothetical protein